MENIKIFENEEFGEIRTVELNNETYFVGKDVAEALGYADTFGALKKHVLDEDRLVCQIDSAGQKREATVINESGLYALIFGSKLESAKRFKHWVTSDVLPSIRKTGTYSVSNYQPKATSVGEVANLLKIIERTMKAQKQSPEVIAKNIEIICRQFGIELTEDFVKVKEYEQMAFLIVGVK